MKLFKIKFPTIRMRMNTRQKILYMLKKRPMRPIELSKTLKLSKSTISEHLKRLEKEKLVRWKGTHRRRYFSLKRPSVSGRVRSTSADV